MWEKIKNFFKWIADHTGISWVARKISSGWKWLFGGKANTTQQNTSQHEERSDNEKQEPAQANDQSKDHTTPKTLDNEVNPDQPTPTVPKTPGGDNSVNQPTPLPCEPLNTTTSKPTQSTLVSDGKKSQEPVINKSKEDKLLLGTASNSITLSLKQALVAQDYKSYESGGLTKLSIYIKCGKDEYCVAGYTLGEPTSIFSVPIMSIVKKDKSGWYLSSTMKHLESQDHFEDVKKMLGLRDGVTTVKVDNISNKPFEAPTLEQPNLNTTTTQQVVNNYTTIDQTTPSAVPNEPQETLVNAHEEKGEPNNAASNEEVQPGVSNEEVDEVLAQDSGKTEETPNSKELKRESSTINVFNGNLELRLADDIQQKLEDYKHPKNNGKYRMEIHCKEDKFNIAFNKIDNADGSLIINTLHKINDKQVLNDINKIKGALGFKKGLTFVVIDSIQKYQPSAKPDGQAQGSGDEPNQSSFDNESVKDDDKEADNPQPEISANGSAPTDSSSFDIVSSQETTPDDLQEPDEDKELARQSEADQKAPANDDGPNSLVAKPEVQTASNDLSHKSQSQ